MTNRVNNSISTIEDVVVYLFTSIRNMRAHPVEDEFHEGYGHALNVVMDYILLNATPVTAMDGS
ncbi:hypothetical protein [Bradyrhizobium diazoefficiens]|uniref:Uncharacterized protein n=1 Tax=Bradyrhizobium diazoefficiens TaxID=1355477 RepID=A0A810D6N2_9BRAD|nr:hypothetical protein XF1B_80160 [Bradyrhizobium diazoefficiens]BCE51594.1 hypothetical protein XF4B_79430 [Bradyrhizobium diazoefficiens]BCE95090.1 hypothetical protein XF10B_78880 [Bradyrhizobium diazoefficiens]BCF30036.1 hypothetical protein XF14B_79880 [Bradyrhizobium diazoefficiens]